VVRAGPEVTTLAGGWLVWWPMAWVGLQVAMLPGVWLAW
jgi:hypothetical protein